MAALIITFILFSVFILYHINRMTNLLCIQKEIPEERHEKIFRTVNILMVILLCSSYIEILYV
ncbi:hypothetical protein RG959_12385 [Domibacillus sp. 8LH]|uniref:hypothetical protein n=1 Tax=Bacillaceae TaxID=186817 RepID=UPI001F572BF6|nr:MULTISPECIES: hypothetical protein [Domibacillus]MCI2253504.1 hypothetical protein [Domibacillus sp. PGB-M46]MCM3787965.1 hypothetical protein [Domibacillus indicus]WNS80096.1 hypothetical protein RRU94_21575 [Domibacillus sp. DTU_2020_1001157_1_SI_ALB_TIR_016]